MAEKQSERYEESELYRIRHSAAHVMAQAVMEMFPGATSPSGRPSKTASITISSCRAHLSRKIWTRSRSACARSSRADIHLCARRSAPMQARPNSRPGLQARADRRPREGRVGRRWQPAVLKSRSSRPIPSDTFTDLCRGPHVERHRPDQPGGHQVDEHCRRLLARRRETPHAAAHLRHRLEDRGGIGRIPLETGRGQEARPPQAGQRAGPVLLLRRCRPRLAALHAPRAKCCATSWSRYVREKTDALRLPARLDGAHGQGRPVQALRALRQLQRRHVPAHGETRTSNSA